MKYRSETQPLCRGCGKPIPKWTDHVWVRNPDSIQNRATSRHVMGPLHSRDDCQRLVNERVVSVRYWGAGDNRHVSYFSVWDGESWADEFFCGGPCRDRLAYGAARAGQVMPEYNEAMRRRANHD